MFQLCLEIPSSSNKDEWISIFVPFDMFVLTSKGYAKEQPMKNDSLNVESIIFLLKDDLMNDDDDNDDDDDTSEDKEEEEDNTEGKIKNSTMHHNSVAFYSSLFCLSSIESARQIHHYSTFLYHIILIDERLDRTFQIDIKSITAQNNKIHHRG